MPLSEVSDGYHTFEELYEHRNLLFCLCIVKDSFAWKSLCHSDSSKDEGWFIAGTKLGNQQITYHLPINLWDFCIATELVCAPEWDGHTPKDVCERIKEYINAAI